MIIFGNKKFITGPFNSEEEIERVVEDNAEYIFGPDSIYLPKTLIHSPDGIGTIPDGFAVDLASKQWFIVETELSSHSVWNHIAPQIAKQIIAASQPSTRRILIELVVNLVKTDELLQEKFDDLNIAEIDIRQVLTEIFEKKPIIGLPIDAVSADLREWAQTLKSEVKLWIVRKLVEFGNPSNILYEIPDEYKPTFDSAQGATVQEGGVSINDIRVVDLIEHNYLKLGEKLFFAYKPRHGTKSDFEADISSEGTFLVLGKEFTSPSYAATYCMQQAGSHRETINGWSYWKNKDGIFIGEMRDQLVDKLNNSDG